MEIFWKNRYVNASYEWPILEQLQFTCGETSSLLGGLENGPKILESRKFITE